jgi:hypothetical protein
MKPSRVPRLKELLLMLLTEMRRLERHSKKLSNKEGILGLARSRARWKQEYKYIQMNE